MRKLKLQVQISVDGYVAGTNGELDWLVWNWDDALKNYVGNITVPVDCIVLGRKLAEGFIPHWASNPDEEGAQKINSAEKVVFTKTLSQNIWPNTKLATGDLKEEINNLKRQNGGDIIAYGGAEFVSSLIENELIDEFHLFVNPAAIGKGLSIFKNISHPAKLSFVKATSFECGVVVLLYKPSKSTAKQ